MDSSWFFCPACGIDVKAPHFCPSGGNGGGVGFKVDLTKYIFPVEKSDPFPDVPTEYTEALAKNDANLRDGIIDEETHCMVKDHIENVIALYRKMNGKEEQS